MSKMPSVLNRDALLKSVKPTYRPYVEAVLKGKTAAIRATKPADGPAAYIWRMVAFIVSPNPQHHCVPAMADFYIRDEDFAHRTDTYQPRCETEDDRATIARWDAEPGGRESGRTWTMMNRGEQRRKFIKEELDPLVDLIIDNVDRNQWHGARRWKKAFYG